MRFASLHTLRTLLLWMCAAATLFADATVRYQSSMKTAPGSPPLFKQQMEKFQTGWGDAALRMKNGKEWSSAGLWTFMVNCTTEQMTLLDTEHHTFSRFRAAELSDKMAAAMPKMADMSDEVKKAMPAMTMNVDSKKTGATDTILGIQAEEREIVMSMAMSMPERAGVQMPPITIRIVMQIWSAKPEEALRNQAIRELTAYKLWTNYFMNPSRMMEKITASMPIQGGFVKSMTDGFNEINTVMLRTRMSMSMSMPPELQKKFAQGADGPMFEMTQEAIEVSNAPVEESLFEIPADYKEIAPEELLRSMLQRQVAAMGTTK